jgi:uncharacterized protein
MPILFEWDKRKAAANYRKHGIRFAEASTAFRDPLSITIADPHHSIDEERFILLGQSSSRKLLVVIHTERGQRIRIISARRATAHERANYEDTSAEGHG